MPHQISASQLAFEHLQRARRELDLAWQEFKVAIRADRTTLADDVADLIQRKRDGERFCPRPAA